jgi:TetR/AcrR family fatty acid metabolism transcriptional regulator
VSKKSGEKYRAIIEAAVKVIAENGYHNSQVSRIAREAGVADGTVYLYFQNKEDVLISLFTVKMGEFITKARSELIQLDNPFDKLGRLIIMHFGRLEEDRKLASVLQIQLRQSDPSIRKSIGTVIRDYYNLIEELVADGINKDCFHQGIEPKLARKMIFGTLDEVTTCWVLSSRNYSLMSQATNTYFLLGRALSKNCTFKAFKDIKPASL